MDFVSNEMPGCSFFLQCMYNISPGNDCGLLGEDIEESLVYILSMVLNGPSFQELGLSFNQWVLNLRTDSGLETLVVNLTV